MQTKPNKLTANKPKTKQKTTLGAFTPRAPFVFIQLATATAVVAAAAAEASTAAAKNKDNDKDNNPRATSVITVIATHKRTSLPFSNSYYEKEVCFYGRRI